MGSSQLISDTRGGGGGAAPKIFLWREGGIIYYRSYPSNPTKTSLYVYFPPQKTLETLQLLTEPKMWSIFTFSRNVSSGVSKFDFSDNFVSKNSAKMHNFTSWHCRGASLSLRSKHFQPSSLFALVPTFSTNSGGNACYASYRGANFDRFSYTLGYRRPLESRGLQRVAPVRGGALDLCPV